LNQTDFKTFTPFGDSLFLMGSRTVLVLADYIEKSAISWRLNDKREIPAQSYHSVWMGKNTGWGIGPDGEVLKMTEGSTIFDSMKEQPEYSKSTRKKLRALWMNPDAAWGWGVGQRGTIYRFQDGQWQKGMSNPRTTKKQLNGISMDVETGTGWIIGNAGTILSTNDGGMNWQLDATLQDTAGKKYRKFPAPWVFIAWMIAGFLMFMFPEKQEDVPEENVEESVADMLVSDRPLEMSDPDPLNFKPIALGLSKFIRNVNTQPPLTIGITGPWGSGKSSLMNLIKSDLADNHFFCTWFNAWHHQKEEHLLASLLGNIHAQAIPSWWDMSRLGFRFRLLKIRLKRNFPMTLVLICLYALMAGLFSVNTEPLLKGVESITGIKMSSSSPSKTDKPTSKESGGGTKAKSVPYQKPSASTISDQELNTYRGSGFLAMLTTLIGGSLAFVFRLIRVFGMRPEHLMATVSTNFRAKDFRQQTGFRHQFSKEFEDMTQAMEPHGLVILIDDLDRCRPENVLEVLEAVNFLVTSGKCFIIMGLDLDRVERCVGLGFKEIADELSEDTKKTHLDLDGVSGEQKSDEETPEEAARRRRSAYARQYLEKLINIEVPVPEPTDAQTVNLLIQERSQTAAKVNVKQWIAKLIMILHPVILLGIAAFIGIWFGQSVLMDKPPAQPVKKITEAPTTIGQTVERKALHKTMPSAKQDMETIEKTMAQLEKKAEFEPAPSHGVQKSPIMVPVIFILIYAVFRLSMKQETIVKDSREFQRALKLWHPFIFIRQNPVGHATPRTLKRFMNRLRYFAMRLPHETAPEASDTLSVGNTARSFKIKEKQFSDHSPLSESMLVALCSLQHFYRDWIDDPRMWSSVKTGKIPEHLPAYHSHQDIFKAVIAAHEVRFGNWPPQDKDFELLLKMSRGIRVI